MLNIKDPKKHHIKYNDLVRVKLKTYTGLYFYFARVIDVNLLMAEPTYAVSLLIDGVFGASKTTIRDINIVKNFGDICYHELPEKFPEWSL